MGYIDDNPNWSWFWSAGVLYWIYNTNFTLGFICYTIVAYTLLKAKNRSMWWILPSILIWVIIPILENRSEKETSKRNRVWELTDENMKLKEELRQHTNKSDDAWYDICKIENGK